MERPDIAVLQEKARELRKDILRMLANAGSGHTGGSLSLVEILISLYFYKMKHDRKGLIGLKGTGWCSPRGTAVLHFMQSLQRGVIFQKRN